MDSHRESARGLFITFEGIEGTGKTTQIEMAAQWLAARGFSCVRTREPGGCPISDQIRAILLDAKNSGLRPDAELLLYVAARAQHVADVVIPALESGKIVLCDRFADATEAYQGYARGLGAAFVRDLSMRFAQRIQPDLTLLLDMPADVALTRARSRADLLAVAHKEDRFEKEALAFHAKVR